MKSIWRKHTASISSLPVHVSTNACTPVHTHPHKPVEGGKERPLGGSCVALPRFEWRPNISQIEMEVSAHSYRTTNGDSGCRNCAETPGPAAGCTCLPAKLSAQHFCQFQFYLRKSRSGHLFNSYFWLLELYQITYLITELGVLYFLCEFCT